jgi:hypothetical protein
MDSRQLESEIFNAVRGIAGGGFSRAHYESLSRPFVQAAESYAESALKRVLSSPEKPSIGIEKAKGLGEIVGVIVQDQNGRQAAVHETGRLTWLSDNTRDGTQSSRIIENLKTEAERLEAELREIKLKQAAIFEHQRNCEPAAREVWYWQGDGEDNLETMVGDLPVVIRAADLKVLLSEAASSGQEPEVDSTVSHKAVLREVLADIAEATELMGVPENESGRPLVDLLREYVLNKAPDSVSGTNRYGLDVGYFRSLINRNLNCDLANYRPDEISRVLARGATTAWDDILFEREFWPKGWELLPETMRIHLDDFRDAVNCAMALGDHEGNWERLMNALDSMEEQLGARPFSSHLLDLGAK